MLYQIERPGSTVHFVALYIDCRSFFLYFDQYIPVNTKISSLLQVQMLSTCFLFLDTVFICLHWRSIDLLEVLIEINFMDHLRQNWSNFLFSHHKMHCTVNFNMKLGNKVRNVQLDVCSYEIFYWTAYRKKKRKNRDIFVMCRFFPLEYFLPVALVFTFVMSNSFFIQIIFYSILDLKLSCNENKWIKYQEQLDTLPDFMHFPMLNHFLYYGKRLFD